MQLKYLSIEFEIKISKDAMILNFSDVMEFQFVNFKLNIKYEMSIIYYNFEICDRISGV